MSAVTKLAAGIVALPIGAAVALGGMAAAVTSSLPASSVCPPASTTPARSGALTGPQVAQYLKAGGWPASQLVTAVAVAKAESGWNPDAINYNSNGTVDRGLFQLNSIHTAILATGDVFDPADNTRMAFALYQAAGSSWAPWVTYNDGSYLRNMDQAAAAVAQLAGAPPITPAAGCVPTTTTAGLGGGPVRQAAVNYALAQQGDPYVWGATGPDSFDCSGLVLAAYRSAGVTVPRTAGAQMQASTIIPASQATTGDLLFTHITGTDAGHVQIVVSAAGGIIQTVQAPHTGDVVKLSTVTARNAVVGRVAV